MPASALDVCNLAIAKAGGELLQALDEGSPLADLCATLYAQTRDHCLGANRWVFAKAVAQLAQLTTAPAGCPMTYAYASPADVVGAIHDFRTGPLIDAFKADVLQLGDYIAAEDAVVWVEYTAQKAEGTWPPWFTQLVATAFAVEVARGMLRREKAAELKIEAWGLPEEGGRGGLMSLALNLDSRNAPKRELQWENGGALVEARLAGGGGFNDPRLARAIERFGG